MAENSKIEWTHHTANLWWGCAEVHDGCDNCYAKALSHRWGFDIWGNSKRRMISSAFKDLDRYQRKAEEACEYHRVFIGSMMDIFEKSMPLLNPVRHYTETDDLRQELFSRIIAELYPNLFLLFLTKRPTNIPKYIPAGWMLKPEPNIMYGISVSDQKTFDTLVPQLLNIPGKHFISMEPQLGPISLKGHNLDRLDWLIQGGESGPHKRPFDLRWAYSMRKQCEDRGIPYFFKQIDKVHPIPESLQIRQFP
jgi:protein gp37